MVPCCVVAFITSKSTASCSAASYNNHDERIESLQNKNEGFAVKMKDDKNWPSLVRTDGWHASPLALHLGHGIWQNVMPLSENFPQ